ncbi:DUF2934 domain-containing protein [Rhizobium lentis]|nr:DUF2934 domain-containing protein [Rhizobium lentis]MBX4989151.1 DUF2934 domain-containing protein [Rhizobium lentis]MBX5007755.1 DUF2934 domain-containing protein [Rhizobium lentis]
MIAKLRTEEVSNARTRRCSPPTGHYQIWESDGRPEGRDGDHRRQAEEQLGIISSSFPAPAVLSSSDAVQGL